MADDVTRIIDIIQPEVFTPYTIQRTMELSNLIQSGIAENNSEFDNLASGPNTLINMPYWNDLTGEPEVMNDTGETIPGKITANKDVARKQGWVKSFGANALAALLSGDDPMRAIADLFASYWTRQTQKILLSILDGVFASSTMVDKVLDITTEDEPDKQFLDARSFIDATQLMGDAKDALVAVMMHSAVEAYLAKNDLIETIQESKSKIEIPTFLRKRVIVDDAMTFDPATGAAEMYIFGYGAIAWGNGSHPDILQTEVVRKGLSLAGEDILVNRRLPLLHPRGIKWTEANIEGVFPNLVELENGLNWERVYEPKAIRIVKFIFKID
jgi:hypothetical protein